MVEAEGPGRVSVCMATYNGTRHLRAQLESIVEQLGAGDEVVVVDDGSEDGTVAMLRAFGDPRIRVLENTTNVGYVRSFERALLAARGRYLLLADQDDVWSAGRVQLLTSALDRADVVASNLSTLNGPETLRGPLGQQDWRLHSRASRRRIRNILGVLAGNRPYYGSAMGLTLEARRAALPFPDYLVESHDLWLALFGNVFGTIEHVDARTVQRRLHDGNQTPPRPRGPREVLASRLMLARAVGTLCSRRLSGERAPGARRALGRGR